MSSYRKESPGPKWEWACALDVAAEFQVWVEGRYGKRLPAPEYEGRKPVNTALLQAGPFTLTVHASGEVTTDDLGPYHHTLWRDGRPTTGPFDHSDDAPPIFELLLKRCQ